MNIEKLISEVRKYTVLYDQNDNKYNDIQHKDKIWKNIGIIIHHSGPQCKRRWNNIRDNLRKSLKKHQKNKAQGKNSTKYKYENKLQFLIPFFKEETLHNVTLSDHGGQEADDKHMDIKENQNDAEDSDTSIESAIYSSSMESTPIVAPKKTLSKKKTYPKSTNQNASSALVSFLLAKEKKEEDNVDAIDSFLVGIGATLKTFPDYQLNVAKSKIFSIVQDMEMKLIMGQYTPNVSLRNHSTENNAETSSIYNVENISQSIV